MINKRTRILLLSGTQTGHNWPVEKLDLCPAQRTQDTKKDTNKLIEKVHFVSPVVSPVVSSTHKGHNHSGGIYTPELCPWVPLVLKLGRNRYL